MCTYRYKVLLVLYDETNAVGVTVHEPFKGGVLYFLPVKYILLHSSGNVVNMYLSHPHANVVFPVTTSVDRMMSTLVCVHSSGRQDNFVVVL